MNMENEYNTNMEMSVYSRIFQDNLIIKYIK